MRIYVLLLAVVSLAVAFAPAVAQEIKIVSPNDLESMEGDDVMADDCCPAFRYQQVYPAEDFLSLPQERGWVVQMAFRPDASVTEPITSTVPDSTMGLSTVMISGDELDFTYANNLGPDETTVFSGDLTVRTDYSGPPVGPKEFDYIINLQTPFYYDASQGNLLWNINNPEGLQPSWRNDWFFSPNASVFGFGTGPTAIVPLGGLVTEFTMLPADPIPLDIKPGSDTNPVNLKSRGVLPVAVLSTDEFDALDLDVDTLLLGDSSLIREGGTAASPLRSSEEDVNADGLPDLTLKFSMRDLVGDGAFGELTQAGFLTGKTLGGADIAGVDAIRIVGQGAKGVPEPSTLALSALGLAIGLAFMRKRKM